MCISKFSKSRSVLSKMSKNWRTALFSTKTWLYNKWESMSKFEELVTFKWTLRKVSLIDPFSNPAHSEQIRRERGLVSFLARFGSSRFSLTPILEHSAQSCLFGYGLGARLQSIPSGQAIYSPPIMGTHRSLYFAQSQCVYRCSSKNSCL